MPPTEPHQTQPSSRWRPLTQLPGLPRSSPTPLLTPGCPCPLCIPSYCTRPPSGLVALPETLPPPLPSLAWPVPSRSTFRFHLAVTTSRKACPPTWTAVGSPRQLPGPPRSPSAQDFHLPAASGLCLPCMLPTHAGTRCPLLAHPPLGSPQESSRSWYLRHTF